jgi:hypothetical protein
MTHPSDRLRGELANHLIATEEPLRPFCQRVGVDYFKVYRWLRGDVRRIDHNVAERLKESLKAGTG